MSDTTKRIIGLTGPAGCGKDTVAWQLSSEFTRYAFAGPLKEALAVLGIFEPTSRAAKEEPLPGRNYSFRTAAQTLGTDWARNLDPDFWLDLARRKTENLNRVVYTDVRFENEATWVRNRGGVIWHITGRRIPLIGEAANHKSETPVAFVDGDLVIDNSGSLDELASKVNKALLTGG